MQLTCCVWMQKKSRSEFHHRKMSYWSGRRGFSWQNKHSTRNSSSGVQRYIGFPNYYRNCDPHLLGKLLEFHELLKAEDNQMMITRDLLDNCNGINSALAEACRLAPKQAIKEQQNVLMTDAGVSSFRKCASDRGKRKRCLHQ